MDFHRDGDVEDFYIVTTVLDLGAGVGEGMLELSDYIRSDTGESSCIIEWVDRESSWFRAGARRGASILEVAGEPVHTRKEFYDLVDRLSAGSANLPCTVSYTKQWDAAAVEANVTALLEITGDPEMDLMDNCTVRRTPPASSLAEKAGLTIGCRITHVEGKKFSRRSEFYRLIAEKRRDGFCVVQVNFTRVLNVTWRDFMEHFLQQPPFEKHAFQSKESVNAVALSRDGMHVALGGLSNEVYLKHLEPGKSKFDTRVQLALDNKMIVSSLALRTNDDDDSTCWDLFVGTNLIGERATVYYYKISLQSNKGPYEIAAARLHNLWREGRRKDGIQAKLKELYPKLAEMKILDVPPGNKRAELLVEHPQLAPFYKDLDCKKPNPRWKPVSKSEFDEWHQATADETTFPLEMLEKMWRTKADDPLAYEVDIESPYELLPAKFKSSNMESARECLDSLMQHMDNHDPNDEDEVHKFYAPEIHRQWVDRQRNSDGTIAQWVVDSGLHVDYSKLPLDEQLKDKVVVNVCRDALQENINATAKFYYTGNVKSISLSKDGKFLAVGGEWLDTHDEESSSFRAAIFNVSNVGEKGGAPIYFKFPERIFHVQGCIHSIAMATETDYYVKIQSELGKPVRLWLPSERLRKSDETKQELLTKRSSSFYEMLRESESRRRAFSDPGRRPVDDDMLDDEAGGALNHPTTKTSERTKNLIALVVEVFDHVDAASTFGVDGSTYHVRVLPDIDPDDFDDECLPRVLLADSIQPPAMYLSENLRNRGDIVQVQLSDQKHVYGTGDRLRLYLKPAMVKVNHKEVKYTVAIGSFSERVSIYTFTAELGPACAARLHEAWRSSRRKAKGDDLPNPRWKKISEDEFEMWRPGVPSEKLAEMYRYAPGLEGDREPDLQWFDENVTQKEKELLVVHNKGHASGRHWVDINQPFFYLPESWKKENNISAIQCIQILGEAQSGEDAVKMFDVEYLAARVHEHWLARQERDEAGNLPSWVVDAGQDQSYQRLSEEEKQKDRDVVNVVYKVKKLLLFMAVGASPMKEAAIILFDIMKKESKESNTRYPRVGTVDGTVTEATDTGLIHTMPSHQFRAWMDSLSLDFRRFVTENEAAPGSKRGLFWKTFRRTEQGVTTTEYTIDMMELCWAANFDAIPPQFRLMLMNETNKQLHRMQLDGFERLSIQYVEELRQTSDIVLLRTDTVVEQAQQFVDILSLSRAFAHHIISMPRSQSAVTPDIRKMTMDTTAHTVAIASSDDVYLFKATPSLLPSKLALPQNQSMDTAASLGWERARHLKVNGDVVDLKLSKNGRRLGVACVGPQASESLLFDAENGGLIYGDMHSDIINSVDVATDGRIMASGGNDNVVNVCNIESGAQLSAVGEYFSGGTVDTASFGRINSICSTNRGTFAAETDDDGRVFVFDQSTFHGSTAFQVASFHGRDVQHTACRIVDLNEDPSVHSPANLWVVVLSEDETVGTNAQRTESGTALLSLIRVRDYAKGEHVASVGDGLVTLIDADPEVVLDSKFMAASAAVPDRDGGYHVTVVASVLPSHHHHHHHGSDLGQLSDGEKQGPLRAYFVRFESNGTLRDLEQSDPQLILEGLDILPPLSKWCNLENLSAVAISDEGRFIAVSGENSAAFDSSKLGKHEWHLLQTQGGRVVPLMQRKLDYAIKAVDLQARYSDDDDSRIAIVLAGIHGGLTLFEVKVQSSSDMEGLPEATIYAEIALEHSPSDIIHLSFSPTATAVSAATKANEVFVWNLRGRATKATKSRLLPHLSFRRRQQIGGLSLSNDCLFFASGRALLIYGHHMQGRCGWRDQPHFSVLTQKMRSPDDYTSMLGLLATYPALLSQTFVPANKSLLHLAAESDQKLGLVSGVLEHVRTTVSQKRDVCMSFTYDVKGSNAIKECIRRQDEASLDAVLKGCFNGGISLSHGSLSAIQQDLHKIGVRFPKVLIEFLKDSNVKLVDVDSDQAVGYIRRPLIAFRRSGDADGGLHWIDVRGGATEMQSLEGLWGDCLVKNEKNSYRRKVVLGSANAQESVRVMRVPIPGLLNFYSGSGSILKLIVDAAKKVEDSTVFDSEIVGATLQFQWYNFGRQIYWFNLNLYLFYLFSTLALHLVIMGKSSAKISCVLEDEAVTKAQIFGLLVAGLILVVQSSWYFLQELEEWLLDGFKRYWSEPQNWFDSPTFITQLLVMLMVYANAFQCSDSPLLQNPFFFSIALVVVGCLVLFLASTLYHRLWMKRSSENHATVAQSMSTETYRRIFILTFVLLLLTMFLMWLKKTMAQSEAGFYKHLANLVALNTIGMFIKLIFFAQGFQKTATVVRAFFRILVDVSTFVSLVLILTVGFAVALYFKLHQVDLESSVEENAFRTLGMSLFNTINLVRICMHRSPLFLR